jgi:uncharacterized OB-fold protein
VTSDPQLFGEERANELSQPYWAALRDGHLTLQRCGSGARWQHYPRRLCRFCHSSPLGWERVSGDADVFVTTIVHRTTKPELQEHVPYRLALVRLREGPVLMCLLTDSGSESPAGSPVVLDGAATRERGLLTFRGADDPTR